MVSQVLPIQKSSISVEVNYSSASEREYVAVNQQGLKGVCAQMYCIWGYGCDYKQNQHNQLNNMKASLHLMHLPHNDFGPC